MTPSNSIIPFGFCQCGCGKKTPVALRSTTCKGIVKGQPHRFIAGHQRRVRRPFECAMPFKLEGVYCRFIRLPDGYITIVDASDYEWLSSYSWYLHPDRKGKVYVVRKGLVEDGFPGAQIRMHRQILGLKPGDVEEGDHRNGDRLNNSRKNLRRASDKENSRNAETRSDNTSGFKGVQRHGNGWRFRVWTDEGRYHSGIYSTPRAAFEARCAMLPEAHQEFARAK